MQNKCLESEITLIEFPKKTPGLTCLKLSVDQVSVVYPFCNIKMIYFSKATLSFTSVARNFFHQLFFVSILLYYMKSIF